MSDQCWPVVFQQKHESASEELRIICPAMVWSRTCVGKKEVDKKVSYETLLGVYLNYQWGTLLKEALNGIQVFRVLCKISSHRLDDFVEMCCRCVFKIQWMHLPVSKGFLQYPIGFK